MADLGYKPNKATLLLSKGADWVCSLTDTGVVWPEGTECWVELDGGPTWDAVVEEATATASFNIQSDATDPIADKKVYRLYLRFPGTPTAEYLWFTGAVKRVDK